MQRNVSLHPFRALLEGACRMDADDPADVRLEKLRSALSALAGAAEAFRTRAVEGLRANREAVRERLEKNPAIATALNAHVGYDAAAKVAKRAAAEGRSVRDVLRELALVPENQLDAVLDVRAMTEPGIPG